MTDREQDLLDARLQAAMARLGSRSNRLGAAHSAAVADQIRAARDYIYTTGSQVPVAETLVLVIESQVFGGIAPAKKKPPVRPDVHASLPPSITAPPVALAAMPVGGWWDELGTVGQVALVGGAALAAWWLWRRYL